jgi:hypothetical protein
MLQPVGLVSQLPLGHTQVHEEKFDTRTVQHADLFGVSESSSGMGAWKPCPSNQSRISPAASASRLEWDKKNPGHQRSTPIFRQRLLAFWSSIVCGARSSSGSSCRQALAIILSAESHTRVPA